MDIFKLVGSIFVDTEEANKSISKTDSKASGLVNTLANGAKKAGKFGLAVVGGATAATAAVAALATKTVDSYADYEQLSGGIETLFKDSSDIVMGYAENAYKTAGMTANEYMNTVTSFSASLLQGLNGDTAKAAEVANMAITDMSDNANKMGSTMESIQNAYNGFAKQNYTMLDNLKLGYGGTKTEMERLLQDATKLSGVEYSIDSLNDVYEAIHVIQTEVGITGTTAKEATSTISGSVGMIKAKFENLKTGIGSSVAPIVQSFLSLVIDNIPVIQELINGITPVIATLAETLLPPLMELVKTLMPTIINLIQQLLPFVTEIMQKVLPIIVELLNWLLPPALQIIETILPVLMTLLGALMPIIEVLFETIKPILDIVIAILVPLTKLLADILQPLIIVIGKLITFAMAPLRDMFETTSKVITAVLGPAFEYVKMRIDVMITWFSGLIDFFTKIFAGDFKGAWESITNTFKTIFGKIKDYAKDPINAVLGFINKLISGVTEGINGLVRAMNNLSFDIPDWVPGMGGKSFGFNLSTLSAPQIPLLAKGGEIIGDGAAIVGEKGPELLNLPQGARVTPLDKAGIDYEKVSDCITDVLHDVVQEIIQAIKELGQNMSNSENSESNIIIPVYIGDQIIDELIIDSKRRVSVRSGGMANV